MGIGPLNTHMLTAASCCLMTHLIGVFLDLTYSGRLGLGKYPGIEGVEGYRRELNGTVHSSCITPDIILYFLMDLERREQCECK